MNTLKLLATPVTALLVLLAGASPTHAQKDAIEVDWLVKPAERAILSSEFARAAVLYQGALTLRRGDPDLIWRLAEIYTMGGQFSLAQEAYAHWLKVGKDVAKTARARSEIARLAAAPAPFVETDDTRTEVRQGEFASEAVKRARALERRKAYRPAIRYLQAALVMDPTLVGAYRLIGTLYGRLKDTASEQAFYVRYLRQVPGGRLANMVRDRLKNHPELGRVTFEASFPCQVFINRGPVHDKRRTPLANIALPSGEYTVVFYNPDYHFGQKTRITVTAGKTQVVKAEFGVLEIRLKPWARVRAKRDGTRGWRDLGLWETIGLPTGRWTLDLKSGDGKLTKTSVVNLKPGITVKVDSWK